ncbi:MAG: AAA family ATPase [Syntrophorhabdaceae bacterium]
MEIPYLEYFGFSEKPFGMSPDPAFYFESAEHKQAIDYLTFFIAQQEGFALIHGDVGSGKTMISRIFLNTLDRKTYNTALILNPVSDETAFMKEVLQEYSAGDIPDTKKELYDRLRRYLLEEFQNGKVNVLIIDEAQLLSYDLLEFIRLLSNIETDKQKILHTVFFAQPEFLDKLKDPAMRHLSQRITVTYCIRPLTYPEVKAYINYRLFKAGAKGSLEFQDRAMKLIHTASRGYPRLINYICDRCLLVLYARSSNTVDGHVVSKVIIEESIPLGTTRHTEDSRRISFRLPIIMTAAVALAVIIGIAVYFFIPKAYTKFYPARRTAAPVAASLPPAVQAQSVTPTAEAQQNPPVTQTKPAPARATATAPTPVTATPGPVNPIPTKPGPALKKIIVNREAANIRSEPNVDSARIGIIVKDEVLNVLDQKNDRDNLTWYKIRLYEGREGWISGAVVTQGK